MGLLPPHYARIERPDAVQQWAALEGKSDTMSDDLYRQHVELQAPSTEPARIAVIAELLIATLDAWWHIRSR